MIKVTRLNRTQFILNAEWIESVEATPDTIITLTNGKRFVVSDSVEKIVELVIEYKKSAGFLSKTPCGERKNADIDVEERGK